MSLPRFATKRPVAIAMLFLAIVLLGAISLSRLPIDLLLDISYPRLVVYTSYPDVAPAEVERLVTERIEADAAAVPGVEQITSVSRKGVSLVTLRFAWGTDMDFALLNTRERMDDLRGLLPETASRPRLLRVDPESDPVMVLSVTGPTDLWETKELAEAVVRRRLEQLDGVARAAVTGGLDREIEVRVDPELLRAYGITPADVAQALASANVSAPGGTILQGRYRYPLRTVGEFRTVQEIPAVVVGRPSSARAGEAGAGLIRLRNIATVADGYAERQAMIRLDGEEAVGLLLFKESGANTVAVAEGVEEVRDHGARAAADGAGVRQRGGPAAAAGDRRDRRPERRHAAHAGRDTGRLSVDRTGASGLVIRLSIRRPVAVTMAYAAVAALGAFAWRNIPIELIPERSLPRLSVSGSWRGASPETVEAFLTSPLEAVIQQVKGVERVTSASNEGAMTVQVEFERDVDMDFARLELSERIATLQDDLPVGVGTVRVDPYIPEALLEQQKPFLTYTLTGPYTLEALRAHLDDVTQPAVTEIEGVGLVRVRGGRRRMLDVRLDPQASRALGLSPILLRQRIAALDLVREAGVVREGAREWTVTIANRPSSAGDVLDAVVARLEGRLVRVRDVAVVSDTYEEATSYNRIDGRPAATFEVIKEIGTNTVAVADRVKARMARLEPLAPYGSSYILLDDESRKIRRQFSDLRSRAGAATIVIFLVLLGFLRSFASATVVFSTIAFSVLITLNLVYFGGFSLNLLTLMGLAMGFGLLVDNCIVVLENVYRRRHAGDDSRQAAEKGSAQVVVPLLASTATNLIVFVPFVYLQGEMRLYYVPLAIVVGLSQVASLLVGFSFIPAVSARLLWRRGRRAASPALATPSGAATVLTPTPEFEPLPLYARFYAGVIGRTLRHPWVTVSITAVMFAVSAWLFDRYVTRGVRWGGGPWRGRPTSTCGSASRVVPVWSVPTSWSHTSKARSPRFPRCSTTRLRCPPPGPTSGSPFPTPSRGRTCPCPSRMR